MPLFFRMIWYLFMSPRAMMVQYSNISPEVFREMRVILRAALAGWQVRCWASRLLKFMAS